MLEVERGVLTELAVEQQRPDGRRVLCGFENHQPFAYTRGDDYFRCADHTLWAHRTDGQLLSVRSGEPIAYQRSNIFYDPITRQPAYYESPHADLLGRSEE
jgi:hypothetical protein